MYPKEQQDLCSGDCNYCRICNNGEVDVCRRSALARGQVGIRSICVFVDCVGLRGAGFVGNWRSGGTRNLCSDVQGIPYPCAAGGGEVRSQCSGAGAGGSGITLPGILAILKISLFIEDLTVVVAVAGAIAAVLRRSAAGFWGRSAFALPAEMRLDSAAASWWGMPAAAAWD